MAKTKSKTILSFGYFLSANDSHIASMQAKDNIQWLGFDSAFDFALALTSNYIDCIIIDVSGGGKMSGHYYVEVLHILNGLKRQKFFGIPLITIDGEFAMPPSYIRNRPYTNIIRQKRPNAWDYEPLEIRLHELEAAVRSALKMEMPPV